MRRNPCEICGNRNTNVPCNRFCDPKKTGRREEGRNANLKHKYGLKPGVYEVWEEAADFVCELCGGVPTARSGRLVVDHDHETGMVRGLLCNRCNTGLGMFKDDPDLLFRASRYISSSKLAHDVARRIREKHGEYAV